MRNLKNRDEYLQALKEGFFKDKVAPTIKKGWEAVKSAFKIGMAKVKDFIAIFDSDGKVLPVVSPQAVIDKFASDRAIKVYAPKTISDSVVAAGGNGCEFKAPIINSDEVYDDESWDNPDDYKNSNEYKNFLSIPSIIQEAYNCSADEANKLFEDMVEEGWDGDDGIVARRIKYSKGEDFAGIKNIDYKRFEEILTEMIEKRAEFGNETAIDSEGTEWTADRNALFFGAPGIGKSSIPNAVITAYNKHMANDKSKMMTLISVDCGLLEEGSLMMPTMPQEVNVEEVLRDFKDTFPQANEYLDKLNVGSKDAKKIASTLSGFVLKVKDSPKAWLPSYQRSGNDDINFVLNAYANSGVYVDEKRKSIETGGGGIILFDELLRADPGIFKQLMCFLLTRNLNGWELGDKWTIIACSNRPCDDVRVEKVWKEWKGSPAGNDRFQRTFQLIPDPEQWKEWIKQKRVDQLFLDFIFDPQSKTGDGEYPRWHSMVKNGAGNSKMDNPIGPRRWEDVIKHFNQYESKHGYKDMSEMDLSEIKEELGGYFDEVFIDVFIDWLDLNIDKVDLDAIMENPAEVYLPEKFKNDPEGALQLIQKLYSELEYRFKDNPKECSDEQLANIVRWLGTNYKDDSVSVIGFITKISRSIFKDEKDYAWVSYIKSNMVLEAAFPPHDIEEDVKYSESSERRDSDRWPEGSLEIIKNYMREYFPWRIDGDEIRYYDEFDMDAVEELTKKIKDDQKKDDEE